MPFIHSIYTYLLLYCKSISILSTIFDVMSHIDGAMMKMEKWKMKEKEEE